MILQAKKGVAMLEQHRWTIGVATSTSILGLTVTSGLIMLANHFVNEFSHPHVLQEMEEFNLTVSQIEPEPPRALQRPLVFQTSDGMLLCGEFWAHPHPAPTVIICHGYRASRALLRPAAAVEYTLGYNVLLFDFRGHGDSESVRTSGGNAEVRDLEAAITVAGMQPETLPNTIIIHGFSMGAAIALLIPPHREVAAIIADSPFARSDEILRRLVKYHLTTKLRQLRTLIPAVAWMIVATAVIVYRMRFGHTFVARPDATFKRWVRRAKRARAAQQPIPILLIHASGDELIPIAHAHRLMLRAQTYGIPLETYFVDHPIHCGAYMYNPEQYTAVIQEFLARQLKDDFPGTMAI
jgi:alpha-beta hydrolase superfamily lysophospholipase